MLMLFAWFDFPRQTFKIFFLSRLCLIFLKKAASVCACMNVRVLRQRAKRTRKWVRMILVSGGTAVLGMFVYVTFINDKLKWCFTVQHLMQVSLSTRLWKWERPYFSHCPSPNDTRCPVMFCLLHSSWWVTWTPTTMAAPPFAERLCSAAHWSGTTSLARCTKSKYARAVT